MRESDDRLLDILGKVLFLEKDEITDDIKRKDHENWDSMAHLMIITEVEGAFGISFEDDEVADIWTVGDLKQLLSEKLGS
jgi:acyl carrier protein